MASDAWLSEKLRAIGWTPGRFAKVTGYRYRNVLSWCKSGENIPEPLRRPLYDAVGLAVDEELGDSVNTGANLVLSRLKSRIGHRAPKSGKVVAPMGFDFGGPWGPLE